MSLCAVRLDARHPMDVHLFRIHIVLRLQKSARTKGAPLCETRRVSVKKLAHLVGAMIEKYGGSHGSEQGSIAEELTSTICCQHRCTYFKSFTPLLLCNNPHESGLIRVPIHAKVPGVNYLSHGAIVACGLCVARFSFTAAMT